MRYMTSADIRQLLKARITYTVTQKHIAKDLGVSGAYLSDYLAGNREVGPTILKKLGFDLTPHYKKPTTPEAR